MSFYAASYEGELYISAEHEQEFKKAVENMYGYQGNIDGIYIGGFYIDREENRYVISSFSEKWTSSEDEFMKTIAPFVEDDSYMCFEGDDSSNWRLVFNQGNCIEQYADTIRIWDTSTATVKHIDEDTNTVIDRSAPTGHYLYLSDEDATKLAEYLDVNKIDYAEGCTVTEILTKNNTTFSTN